MTVFEGLTIQQLADIADDCGIDGPADQMITFARRIRLAALNVNGKPVLMTVLNEPATSGVALLDLERK